MAESDLRFVLRLLTTYGPPLGVPSFSDAERMHRLDTKLAVRRIHQTVFGPKK